VRLGVDARGDGGPHKREEEVEAEQHQPRRLAGAREVVEEAEVGEEAEGEELGRDALCAGGGGRWGEGVAGSGFEWWWRWWGV